MRRIVVLIAAIETIKNRNGPRYCINKILACITVSYTARQTIEHYY